MDFASIMGLVIGLGAIVVGSILEGLHIGSLIQPTAALVVFGGTLGAVILSVPFSEFIQAVKGMKMVFQNTPENGMKLVEDIVKIASIVRRESILAIEKMRSDITNPILSKGLQFVIDGYDPTTVRHLIELEIENEEAEMERRAKVYEFGGGFSPTIGIIGAVLGLIHTLSQLNDPSKVGAGISVAFVATVYGVGLANLVLLPVANRIRRISSAQSAIQLMILEGIMSIQSGENPRIIEEKLKTYMVGSNKSHEKKETGDAQQAAAA